ncbi:MAG: hypothetical protein V1903_14165 [Bacteroidota bacterium]
MNPKSKEILLGVIACMLLLIYLVTLGSLILSVLRWEPAGGNYIPGINAVWVINLLGGLVSGVVISNLALADSGSTPLSQVKVLTQDYGRKLMKGIVWIYIIVWLLIGFSSFYIGVIRCPDVSVTLNEIGKSWLGILVGAAYAWFGIKKTA